MGRTSSICVILGLSRDALYWKMKMKITMPSMVGIVGSAPAVDEKV